MTVLSSYTKKILFLLSRETKNSISNCVIKERFYHLISIFHENISFKIAEMTNDSEYFLLCLILKISNMFQSKYWE